MKCWIILIWVLCIAGAARANPVVSPIDTCAYLLVVGSAAAVEAGIITLILIFWGTEPMPVYMIFIAGNVILYFAIFRPMLELTSSVWIAETLIACLDGVLIKTIMVFDGVRADTFRPLKWGYAFIIAAIGNVISYYVGAVITG